MTATDSERLTIGSRTTPAFYTTAPLGASVRSKYGMTYTLGREGWLDPAGHIVPMETMQACGAGKDTVESLGGAA